VFYIYLDKFQSTMTRQRKRKLSPAQEGIA
jgi:hypothetical protein